MTVFEEAFVVIRKWSRQNMWTLLAATFVYGIILGKFILGRSSPKRPTSSPPVEEETKVKEEEKKTK